MAQTPDEKTYVEIPFIEQLKGMGWDHIEGDIDVPYLTERESFRNILLTGRLRKAIKKINLDDEGKPWLDDDRVNELVHLIERGHTDRFWHMVARVMPEYEEHARWLNENGANLDL